MKSGPFNSVLLSITACTTVDSWCSSPRSLSVRIASPCFVLSVGLTVDRARLISLATKSLSLIVKSEISFQCLVDSVTRLKVNARSLYYQPATYLLYPFVTLGDWEKEIVALIHIWWQGLFWVDWVERGQLTCDIAIIFQHLFMTLQNRLTAQGLCSTTCWIWLWYDSIGLEDPLSPEDPIHTPEIIVIVVPRQDLWP